MDNIRLPRPLGITQALSQYHLTHDPNLFNTVQELMIQQWLINNQELCGRMMTILELAQFLHCEPEKIRLQMRDQLLNTKLWDKDKQEDLINSLLGEQVAWALEDRMAIEHQVKALQKSQGNKYMPFVTSEVNRALGMKLQSTANLTGILKSLQGGGSINIFNNQTTNNIDEQINLEQVINIIGEENAKIAAPDKDLKFLAQEYHVEELPEVVATKQLGVHTEKEGLAIASGELDQITDNYKGVLNSFEEDHHQIRREIELQVDPSEDDPEMLIYPQ